MGTTTSSPAKKEIMIKSPQQIPSTKSSPSSVNKAEASRTFNLKASTLFSASAARLSASAGKYTIEFVIVFFIVALFIIGLIFASPVDEFDLGDLPPPPIWSRGIARPANVVNSTVTDSFALLKSVGFNPSSILDVGAFSGEFSRAAEKWFPEAEIFLIESCEDRRDDLMKTGLSYMIATVGSKPEKVDFYELSNKKANSRFKEMTEDYINENPVRKVSYPVDMLMEGLPEISMMKIDTQGSELEVLKGAIRVLKDVEVLYITVPLMRIHRGAPLALQILSYCKEIGFELLNYVDGDARGDLDALVHVDLTLAKVDSPLFSKISEGIVIPEATKPSPDEGEEEDRSA